jgi:hypothetical protein
MTDKSFRFPWAEATTPEVFKDRLARSGGRLGIALKSGEDVWATKYRSGVVYLEGGGKVRLSSLVWTPLGYQEIASDKTGVEERALEALAQMDRRIAIAGLDAPRDPLAILSRRLEEERLAQEKAGTTEFQTLDPLTEKVIVSWLRDVGQHFSPDEIADMIDGGEHRHG